MMTMVRSILTLLFLSVLLADCDTLPNGPGAIIEPVTTDQLIPLHTGNSWHYRDAVGGTSAQPSGLYFIGGVPRIVRCYRSVIDPITGLGSPSENYQMEVYTNGTDAWSANYDGILIGSMNGPDAAVMTHSLPKNPVRGALYDYDNSLLCRGVDTVTTPAGTFACVHFNLNGITHQYWFARGIGLVQQRTFGDEGQLIEDWQLDSYVLKN